MTAIHPQKLLERPFGTLAELIAGWAAVAPNQPALIQDARQLDFAELDRQMDAVAAALQREGVEPGEAIALCGLNSIDYAVVFLGALRAGVAVAPLAPSASAQSLHGMLEDAQARLLFVDAVGRDRLAEAPAVEQARHVALDALGDWLGDGHSPRPVEVNPQSAFNIIYSSGTTGTPKGIVQSHAMRWAHIRRSAAYAYGCDARALISTPLYSNTTLVAFLPALALGGTVVLLQKFDAGHYLELAARHRITHSMLVPVQYQRIMAHPAFETFDLSAFRYKFCTSAPFHAELKADVLRRWPGGLVEFYGMTEGGGTCILEAHLFRDKLHTVGRPADGHDIRLIDESGRELPPGSIGEVVGHSPAMMQGYLNKPDKTAEAEWFDGAGKRFIRTGDVGRFDADGFLTLLDRRKDMIISGGFNLYPSDLEGILREHPAVADVTVVGIPSRTWGESPVAFVVAREDARESAEQLLGWFNARVGKTQRLARLEWRGELPRSAIGKVLKRELRDEFLAREGELP